MQFELPKDRSSIIKVIGVGGGGSNAVNHMFRQGIKGVDFIVCNTDAQALDISPVPTKIQLGANLTEGLGAGSLPEVGKNSAIETIEDIRKFLGNNTKMVFITAGMGGGTGTGAAPIIASVAKEMGILTVGIVTLPFSHEGKRRKAQADEGINQLKKNVDTLLVISNDKLREIYGNLKLTEAFVYADDVLTTAAKSIAEIITVTLHINVDFADIQTVMKDSGAAIMGSAMAAGENRAVKAVENALNSPLLNDNNISGARYVLLNVVSGKDEITMDEYGEIMDYVQDAAGQTAEIIKGYGIDENLGDKVSVTIIATGFKTVVDNGTEPKKPERKVMKLEDASVPKVESTVPVLEQKISNEPELKVAPVAEKVAEPELKITPVTEKVAEPEMKITPIVEKVEEPEMKITLPSEPRPEPMKEQIIAEPVNEATPAIVDEEKEISEQAYIIDKSSEEVSMEFDIPKTTAVPSEPVIRTNVSEPVAEKASQPAPQVQRIEPVVAIANKQSEESVTEQYKRAQERIRQLKALSMKLKSPSGLAEMEKEPAYKRREVKLEAPVHSSESEISRFTLSEDEEKKTSIKQNNTFLHDNVD